MLEAVFILLEPVFLPFLGRRCSGFFVICYSFPRYDFSWGISMLQKIGILFLLLCALCGVSASEVGGGSAGPGGGSGCSVRIIGGGYFFPCEELGGIVLEEDGVIREITSWSALLLNKYAHLLPSKINAFFALPNWSNFA